MTMVTPNAPTAPATGAILSDATTGPVTEPTALTPPPGEPLAEARQVIDTFLDPVRWAVLGQRLLLIALVILATLLALRVGRRLLLDLQVARNLPDTVMLPLRRTLRWGIIIIAVILGLQFAGFSMVTIWTGLSAVLALLGVAFIAVWSVLSNIACSLMLLIFKPFRIGDEVEFVDNPAGPNVGGRVTDVTLMYVVLREEKGEGSAFIQVPNNLFFQKTIRRRRGKRSVPIEQHVEKHGLNGREQTPPGR